jgi:hypothetical protein
MAVRKAINYLSRFNDEDDKKTLNDEDDKKT